MNLFTGLLNKYKAIGFLLLISTIKVAYAGFPIEIQGSNLRIGPAIRSSSAITYNDKIYTYGGVTDDLPFTTDLYVYEFFEGNGSVTLRKEEYSGPAPKCSHCNPVLLPNTSKMLILAYDMEELFQPQNWTTVPHVLPYIYDFETKTWSIEAISPKLNSGNQSHDIFGMRVGHTVTIARNGLIYVIGGRSFYRLDGTKCLTSVWYYNRADYSYNALAKEAPDCFIDSNAYTTLYDDKIRLLFGGTSNSSASERPANSTGAYELPVSLTNPMYVKNDYEFSIDTATNEWDMRPTTGEQPFFRSGATLKYHPKTDLAYLTGGAISNLGTLHTFMQTFTLNVSSGAWVNHTYNIRDFGLDKIGKSYASSAIVKDKYYAVLYGQHFQGSLAYNTREVEIFRLPDTNDLSFNRSEYKIDWLNTLMVKPEINRLDTKYIITIVVLALCLTLVIALVGLIYLARKRKSLFSRQILSILWFRRNGEQPWVENSRLIVKIIFMGLFCAFIAYSVESIINSPITFTTAHEPLTLVPLPDVRICLSGWNGLYQKPNPPYYFPEIDCQILGGASKSLTPGQCKKSISALDNTIHQPYYVDQQNYLQCFLFRSSDQFSVKGNSLSIKFRISGTTRQRNEAIYIKLYDADQDPNRYLFFNESLPEGYSNADIQDWVASDNNIQQAENSYAIYAESSTSIKFQRTEHHNLDPDSSWNYFGSINPQYKVTKELSSTFAIPAPRNFFPSANESYTLSDIQISPMTSTLIVHTYKRADTVLGMLGAVGGIISLLSIVHTILFGTRPFSPWGIAHRIRKRQQLETLANSLDVERYYNSLSRENKQPNDVSNAYTTSVPFSEPVDPRFVDVFNKSVRFGDSPDGATKTADQSQPLLSNNTLEDRIMRLESRNQILELALKSYYIDEEIFQSLKETRQRTTVGVKKNAADEQLDLEKVSPHYINEKIHQS